MTNECILTNLSVPNDPNDLNDFNDLNEQSTEDRLKKLENILSLKCLVCGKQYRPGEVDYVCPDHGDEGVLDVQYDYDFIGRQISRETLLRARVQSQLFRHL